MRSLFLLIFCLFAFPCQAKEMHCLVRGAPCYIKSETIILREGPSRDSKILHSIQPKKILKDIIILNTKFLLKED